MSFPTDKTIVAVRIEGNLFDENGDPITENIERLNAMADSSYIIICSHAVETDCKVRLLFDRLNVAKVRYDEVWASYGIPKADIYIDQEAIAL